MFIERISEKFCKLRNYMSDIWLYNNSYKINRANLLLVYMDMLRGGLAYTWLQILDNQRNCQTAETTIDKSLIEDLLGTFLLVQQL